MSVSAVSGVNINSGNSVNFKASKETKLVNVEKHPDFEVRTYETAGSAGKKWGVGIASAIVPGAGQAINGKWGKGFGFLAAYGLSFLGGALALAKGRPGLAGAAALGAVGINIWSIVNAVKNARSNEKVIVENNKPKENLNTIA